MLVKVVVVVVVVVVMVVVWLSVLLYTERAQNIHPPFDCQSASLHNHWSATSMESPSTTAASQITRPSLHNYRANRGRVALGDSGVGHGVTIPLCCSTVWRSVARPSLDREGGHQTKPAANVIRHSRFPLFSINSDKVYDGTYGVCLAHVLAA